MSPMSTLKSFFWARIRFQTSKLFQYGSVSPGSGRASWSPESAKRIVFACFAFGAVVNLPVSLLRPPYMQKRYL